MTSRHTVSTAPRAAHMDGVLEVDDAEPLGGQGQGAPRIVAASASWAAPPDHPEVLDRQAVEEVHHPQHGGHIAPVVRLHPDLDAVPLGEGRRVLQPVPCPPDRGGIAAASRRRVRPRSWAPSSGWWTSSPGSAREVAVR
ncbi:hypothetical protein JBE04_18540 [Streptomyces sp. PRKS01-29]|nr:hypothetical protein [Streptomyces sabulosicollis]MBI0296408.1 hypothetical protein [Streptomyces sabulosicollis]